MKELPRRSRNKRSVARKPSAATQNNADVEPISPWKHWAVSNPALYQFACWWLASFSSLLATNPFWLADRVPVWPVRDTSILAMGRVYSPPLASLPAITNSTHWTYWQFAVVAGLLYAWIAVRLSRETHWMLAAGFIWTLSHFDTRGALLGGAALWLAIFLRDSLQSTHPLPTWLNRGKQRTVPRTALIPWACCIVSLIAAGTTIEFGLVLVVVGAAMLEWLWAGGEAFPSRRARVAWAIGWLASIAVATLVVPGFAATLLRPWNWMWLPPPPRLFASLSPLWDGSSGHATMWHGVLLVFIAWQWLRLLRTPRPQPLDGILLATASILAVGCSYYCWLAGILSAGAVSPLASPDADSSAVTTSTPQRRAEYGGALAASAGIALLLIQAILNSSTILSADLIQRRVVPTASATPGPVLLLNLDHTARWQSPELNTRFPLLLNDRWEVYAPMYAQFEAVGRDWKEWKREAYLRIDGSWGGYHSVFQRWRPSLIALDAEDDRAIRQVTLDSQWKIVGVDAEEILFGAADDPRAVTQALRCLSLFSFLEVPRSAAQIEFTGALALGGEEDSLRIANAMTAMRMPLAALRIAPRGATREARFSRSLAYFELAHRTLRYSGHISLLDSVRAQRVAAKLLAGSLPASARRRLTQAQAALAESSHQVLKWDSSADATTAERALLRHIVAGELAEAVRIAEDLQPAGLRELYLVLFRVDVTDPIAIQQEIDIALQAPSIPASAAAEFHFYVGQLALEAGRIPEARSAFEACLQRAPSTPFRDLASFYLTQMQSQLQLP